VKLLIRLQEGVLDNVLGIFLVLRNVPRDAEDLPVVLADELLKRSFVPSFSPLYEGYVRVYLFRRWGLDGRHRSCGAEIWKSFAQSHFGLSP
jgi:hypothetical protein